MSAAGLTDGLPSWNDTPTRRAIVDFVRRVTEEGSPDYVPPVERVAVFDNDGTLWCEKPMPVELGFVLKRFAEQAEADPALRTANRGRRHASTTITGSARSSPSTITATIPT
jgi:hypothetical protein